MYCDSCKLIVTDKRGSFGHDGLVKASSKRADIIGQSVWLTDYVCSNCGKKWRYEDDKNDSFAGWSEL